MSDKTCPACQTAPAYRRVLADPWDRHEVCAECSYCYTHAPAATFRTDYTAPGVEPYWDREAGSASSLLLLAGLIPLAFVVWFLAHVAGAVATVGGVQ